MFEKFTRPPQKSPIGSYRVEVISLPEECDWEEFLPAEIRYLFRWPEYKERIRTILSQGKAIGVRTVLRTPENILQAINTVSVYSQHNYILTWLPVLLRDQRRPRFLKTDRVVAKEHGKDLDQAIGTILHDRLQFKKLVLIDEENIGIKPAEQQLMSELSELIYPLAIDYSVSRVIADNARERTAIAQTIIKMLLIVGPIAHILEKFAAGIGKVFAASIDDVLGESAELMALRGSGFKWRELVKRSRVLVPVFALASWGAFSVHHLIAEGHLIQGGVIFGLSAVALSLTTAIQSLFMYRKNLQKLILEDKVKLKGSWNIIKAALAQDFTNPARLGLFIGASLAPLMGIIGSLLGLMSNGWALAAIGSTESIVAGLTVILSGRINELRFKRRLMRYIHE